MEGEARPGPPLGDEAATDRTNVWVGRWRERPPGVGQDGTAEHAATGKSHGVGETDPATPQSQPCVS